MSLLEKFATIEESCEAEPKQDEPEQEQLTEWEGVPLEKTSESLKIQTQEKKKSWWDTPEGLVQRERMKGNKRGGNKSKK